MSTKVRSVSVSYTHLDVYKRQEEALPYLKEHQQELNDRIYCGKYTPSPVRRVEIPKPDGGVRKLGIPTVIDRTLQQAITQQLVPIYELLFAEGSYGYRPNRSAKDAILKVKEYAEQGYTFAVVLDLSKYFDTLNHEILINILRKNVKDERVVQLIKRYLKSGVMENGVVINTEEGLSLIHISNRPGFRPYRKGSGICRGGEMYRSKQLRDHFLPYSPELYGTDHRSGIFKGCIRDPFHIRFKLPGPRRKGSDTGVGRNAFRRTCLLKKRSAPDRIPGYCDHHYDPFPEPVRRWSS